MPDTGAVLARSFARGTLATSNLAMIPAQSRLAATLVHTLALTLVQARDDAFGKFAA